MEQETGAMEKMLRPGGDSNHSKIRSKLKELLEKNNKLVELALRAKKKISRLKKEKEILIDKIAQYELESPQGRWREGGRTRDASKHDVDKRDRASVTNVEHSSSQRSMSDFDIKDKNKGSESVSKNLSRRASAAQKRKRDSIVGNEKVEQVLSDDPTPASEKAKQKVSKRHSVMRKTQDVPRDETGQPILPIKLGSLTVLRLGTIVYDREKFHSRRYIWPVGFESSRLYFSMKTPDKHIIYTSRILDGESGPLFQVVPEDDSENPITAPAASTIWTTIMRKVNESKSKGQTSSASGPEYFGFGHPTIARLIQGLPNADKCKNYEMQPHHAATSHPDPTPDETLADSQTSCLKEPFGDDSFALSRIQMNGEYAPREVSSFPVPATPTAVPEEPSADPSLALESTSPDPL